MRTSKLKKSMCFLVVISVLNMTLSFFIEPVGGASGRMWNGYYKEEKLDTIFVGSSICQMTFIPQVFDEKLGIKSYNMGTPSQAMPQSIRAIEVALQEHDIKTVIYAMNFSSLKYKPIPEAEITFESARVHQKGGLGSIKDTMEYIYSFDVWDSEKSINFLFPWLYNHEDYTMDTLIKNASGKIERVKEWLETGEYDGTDGLIKGFRNDERDVFNYDNMWTNNTGRIYESYFDAEMLSEFEEMAKLCVANDIELIVIHTPHPAFDVITCYDSYEKNQNQVVEVCNKYNVDYYDFSLAKAEIYEINGKHFGDYEHLNKEGAKVFCEKVSDFLIRREDGEDMSQYFYSVEEFLELNEELLEEWKVINK